MSGFWARRIGMKLSYDPAVSDDPPLWWRISTGLNASDGMFGGVVGNTIRRWGEQPPSPATSAIRDALRSTEQRLEW